MYTWFDSILLNIDTLCNSRNRYNNNHPYSQDSPSHRGSETEEFSESDCEKDIDICDDDHKVTSSSAETPVSLKDLDEEDDDVICSPGDRSSPSDDTSTPTSKGNSNHHNNTSSKKSAKGSRNKVEMKGRCNCDELLLVNCHLETKELWDKFHELGTEMIITKTGR